MEHKDKPIVCRECGSAFIWTAGEQDFFEKKGLTNAPTRCPICRKKRDVKHDFEESYEIVCAECGKKAKSPFKPEDPKKVLCQECFLKKQEEAQKASSTDSDLQNDDVSLPDSQVGDASNNNNRKESVAPPAFENADAEPPKDPMQS